MDYQKEIETLKRRIEYLEKKLLPDEFLSQEEKNQEINQKIQQNYGKLKLTEHIIVVTFHEYENLQFVHDYTGDLLKGLLLCMNDSQYFIYDYFDEEQLKYFLNIQQDQKEKFVLRKRRLMHENADKKFLIIILKPGYEQHEFCQKLLKDYSLEMFWNKPQ